MACDRKWQPEAVSYVVWGATNGGSMRLADVVWRVNSGSGRLSAVVWRVSESGSRRCRMWCVIDSTMT